MGRERMVTRTVNGYNVTVMCVDTSTATVSNQVFVEGGDYIPGKGLDILRKRYETNTTKLAAIISTEMFERLYGMPEQDFIRKARLLPPRGEGGRTRERMVTRTVNGYNVTVMCVDTSTATVSNQVFVAGADYIPEKGLEILRKRYETSTTKLAAIISTEMFEQLYGMPEADFIKQSAILPPRSANDAE